MLPGLINQVSLDWSKDINYYLPTIKRYKDKLYLWKSPSGPNLGGAKEPGLSGTGNYWQLINDVIATTTHPRPDDTTSSDWNNFAEDGTYFVQSIRGKTKNAPLDIDAWWWVKVSTCIHNNKKNILLVARMHSTATSDSSRGSAHVLSRCFDGSRWGAWVYDYTAYAG